MDALTDILNSIQLAGGVYFRCNLTAPWGMQMDDKPTAEFHVVVRGTCWLIPPGVTTAIQLQAGDLLVFPHGQAHTMMDAPTSLIRPAKEVVLQENLGEGAGNSSANAPQVSLLCGYFQFDPTRRHALLDGLPSFIHIRGTDVQELSWLQTTINFINFETKSLSTGSEAVVNRLVEVLFVQIMRAYIAQADTLPGILGAIADPKVGLALNAMHQQPGHDWSLESLANTAGMSRSAFAQRFVALANQTPMQYLTFWRMQLARRWLESSQLSMASIAEKVGYQSEASFSKVFKRSTGMSPGACRRLSGLSAK